MGMTIAPENRSLRVLVARLSSCRLLAQKPHTKSALLERLIPIHPLPSEPIVLARAIVSHGILPTRQRPTR